MRDYPPKREKKKLPPEKLYGILRGLYYEELADEIFEKLMGYKPHAHCFSENGSFSESVKSGGEK